MVSLYLLLCLILNGFYSTIGLPTPTPASKDVSLEYLQNLLAKGQYEEFSRLLLIDADKRMKAAKSGLDMPDEDVPLEYLQKLLANDQYEEFARLLQIDDGKREKNATYGPDNLPEDAEYDDMMWTSWQKNQPKQGNFYKNIVKKWNFAVPFVLDHRYTQPERDIILEAIEQWNIDLALHVVFVPHVIEKDYVMFVRRNGCSSNVGKIGGPQVIFLSDECLIVGVILHEMAHAVGMIHEQMRPDRDTYIELMEKNIPSGWLYNYRKLNYTGITDLGPYDYYSLMHYPIPAPVTHLPAFKVLQKGINLDKIGQRNDQSEIDKDKIKRLYRIL